jgi:hypothetical protein
MVSGSLFFRLSTNAGTAEILISDIWFLSSGSGAAVRASLLPRYQEPGIRHQASGIRTDADPPPAFAKRLGLAGTDSDP